MKIYRYAILEQRYASDLELKVMEWIKAGWQPLGGVSVTREYANSLFAQAMVKYEEPAK